MKLQRRDGNQHFETLADMFFREHPEIPHARREVTSAIDGGRTLIACYPGTPKEVSASLSSWQITVGSGADERDFEDFGRKLSDEQVAIEAFAYFTSLVLGRH